MEPNHSGTARVRVLGPIVLAGPDGPVALPGARCRTLLALLALNTGQVITYRRLIDALYGEDPPRTALRSLHSHISRVRQALQACGEPDAVQTGASGYQLCLPPDAVDAHRFDALAARGRAHLAQNAIDCAIEDLRAGLDLWHGHPLADGEPGGWAAAEVDRLAEARLVAHEDLWDARLRGDTGLAAIDELERLLVEHPTRERLVGLLMLALCRAGRPAAALDRYERLRLRLADEFGVDPGPWLRELHGAILRDEVTPSPNGNLSGESRLGITAIRPAQLPPVVGYFTGRAEVLAELGELLDDGQAETKIAVVSGPGGIGKTALAVHWAHRVRDRFPDGQIFLDLRGHDPDTALAPTEVLGHVLRGLGVLADRVPSAADEQARLYRSLMLERQVLLVLDNAGTADHVAPLAPPTSASMLVITSRRRLTALAIHHPSHLIELGVLTPAESVGLLGRIIGGQRVALESGATADLARLCGHNPLALRIVAANLAARPRQRVADLVAELAGERRLDALAVAGDPRTVRAVFASAYETLSEGAARLFRRLGLHPGAGFGIGLVAALDDRTFGQTRRVMDELAATHLVVEVDSGRYRLHDLIQLFARERLAEQESGEQRAAIAVRLLDWYLAVADAANRILDPGRDRVVVKLRHPLSTLPFAPEANAVLSYLDSEYGNVRSIVGFAVAHGEFLAASQLSYLIAGYFDSRGHAQERVEIYRSGLAAAEHLGDPVMEGLMCSGLGVACIAARRFEDALVHLGRALELMREAGDKRGEGHVHNNIAVALGELRRYHEAIAAGELALAVHDASGHGYGMIIALNNQGHSYARIGQYDAGLDCLYRALDLARHLGVVRWEAWVLNTLGEAQRDRGHLEEAVDRFEQSLRLRRQTGDRSNEALTLVAIGATHLLRAAKTAGTGPLPVAAHPAVGNPAPVGPVVVEPVAAEPVAAELVAAELVAAELVAAELVAAELVAAEPVAAELVAAEPVALAAECFAAAAAIAEELGDRHQAAVALAGAGRAALLAGDPATALRHTRRALTLRTLVPDWYEEAGLRRTLGELAWAADDRAEAAAQWAGAIDLFRRANAPDEAREISAMRESTPP